MCISAVALLGGVLWTIFYVRGYMKRMENITLELLKLSIDGRTESRVNAERLDAALEKAAAGIESLSTAMKMSMGVNVLASLLPTIIGQLTGGKSSAQKK